MSFGFGAGDILAIGTLVWNVYSAYAGAPEQFRNFSQEILSLHVVVRKVEDQLGISGSGKTADVGTLPGSGGVVTLSAKDKNDLKILYNGLQTVVKELHDLLNTYRSLASNRRNPIDKLRWGQEDLAGLRDKLLLNVTLLTSFNASLAKCVFSLFT